ncbi:ABC transporter ATP-binding protein [Cryobacterium levicorallinum]|uniref:ABC transporter ATP-binding protein n=1 Tax=Cryobacterium levicorallinum TaxID=995038 RepID=A0A1I3BYA9_9MICO|nr:MULTISPECIES: ABC transporter ATP-binding protein [Cryobacterium]TFB85667.1 ABC transporter ATP-binding protein [Cryobacterium levicorallinum]GEP27248.1 ABC transporter ATP-binding protein [Cryobacterium levicorallinum]SFH67348.1 peptide/nickel transport system ATP-binding protein [Cryobacterium levicorallinum]
MSATAALTVHNLRVGFGATESVVNGVSFEIAPGECLAIVGESGSGKSVTARSLLGLAGGNARVQADRLDLGGRSVLGLTDRAWQSRRGKDVGLVLQDALVSLDPLRPIGREIADSLRLHTTLGAAARARRVVELLDAVGLPDPAQQVHKLSGQLSGGERQRALIAAAIALGPPLLIADEPTTALDVTVQAQILALLEQIKLSGTALLLISHDLAVVSRIADRVAVMHNGRFIESGQTEQVLGSPQHEQTRRMVAAVPADKPRGSRLSPLDSPATQTVPRSPAPAPNATEQGEIVLEAIGLTRSFRRPDGSRQLAVDDVSFALHRGSTLGIVGESGSGKTTTARLMLALLKPEQGEVALFGRPWSSIAEKDRRGQRPGIGAIYQDALGSFDPRRSVAEILADALGPALTNSRGSRRSPQSLARLTTLLDEVELAGTVLPRRPLELSGGQRQRVGIARALAGRPEILICDEPVSSLDVSVQAQVLDLLDDVQRERGLSLIFISHDLGVVQHISDEVAVMRSGRIVESGPAARVFAAPQHPYSVQLLSAVPRLLG